MNRTTGASIPAAMRRAGEHRLQLRARSWWWVLALLGPVLAACDGAPTDGDAGPDAAPSIAPPDIPWLADGVPPIAPVAMPQLTPCPTGWREVPPESADGVATCDPYPTGGPAVCAMGSAHFPGEPGCVPVGSACPAGEWADDLPAAGVVYVRAGEPSGGDGSAARPFGRIVHALAVVASGGTVALARGTYDEALELTQPVTIRGACSAETLLTTSDAGATAVVEAQASDVVLRDLRVGESPVPGLWVESAAWSMRVDGVIVERATLVGVLVARGAFTGRSLIVRNSAPLPGGTFGQGFQAQMGASVEVARALFERNRDVGVLASGTGTTVRLEDVVVRDTQSERSDGTGGRGLSAIAGASVEVARGLFEQNRLVGIFAGTGTTVRLEDTVVRDTQSQDSDGKFGRGLNAEAGASVEVARGLFERNRELGVFAFGVGTTVRLEDTIVRDTQSQESDRTSGRGLSAMAGASVEVARGLFERNRDLGVFASGTGTTVQLEDTVVRDTQSRESDGKAGRGLHAQEEASVEVARGLFEHNRDVGVFAGGTGTTVRLEDTVVRDTQSQETDLGFGWGLGAQEGASVEVARGLFERNRDIGVFASGTGTTVRLEDTVVRETQSRESDGRFGRGLGAQEGASVEVARGLFERNREVGVFAHGTGTTLRLEDTVVRDTLPAECGASCLLGAGGMGAGSHNDATLTLERFVITRAALCGVHMAFAGLLELRDGEVSESEIGACVQVPGYPLSLLQDRVLYRDNVANIEATSFPTPMPSEVIVDP